MGMPHRGTLDEPGGEPTARTLSLLDTEDDVWTSKSRIWPDGTLISKVFSRLYIHRQMSLRSVDIEYKRLPLIRHPDKVPDDAKMRCER